MSEERFVWGRKAKALAAGLLVAGMVATSMMAASPAHASTTFTVNDTGDAPDAFTTSNTCDTDGFKSGDQCTLRAASPEGSEGGRLPSVACVPHLLL